MKVTKAFKYSPEQFSSYLVEVSLSHDEIGMVMPDSVESLRRTFSALSMEAEALLLIEQVKLGRIHPNQISEKLAPWVMHNGIRSNA